MTIKSSEKYYYVPQKCDMSLAGDKNKQCKNLLIAVKCKAMLFITVDHIINF